MWVIAMLISLGFCSFALDLIGTGIDAAEYFRGIASPNFVIEISVNENPSRDLAEIKHTVREQWLQALVVAAQPKDIKQDYAQFENTLNLEVEAKDPTVIVKIKNEGRQAVNLRITILSKIAFDQGGVTFEDHDDCRNAFENETTLAFSCDRFSRNDSIEITLKFIQHMILHRIFGLDLHDKADPTGSFSLIEKSETIGRVFVNADDIEVTEKEIMWGELDNGQTEHPGSFLFTRLTLIVLISIAAVFFLFRIDRYIFFYLLGLFLRRR
jgi:hypothetical protein